MLLVVVPLFLFLSFTSYSTNSYLTFNICQRGQLAITVATGSKCTILGSTPLMSLLSGLCAPEPWAHINSQTA